ncbi:MAG: HAMP domain-containing protein, partial [Clostridia bacterium]|nr:HAMP domain-containing protein [Clostridia bacterium]
VVSIRPSHDFNLILSILPRFAFTILLTMVLFALLSILVSFTISKPVTQLTQATQQIKAGDFTVRLPDNKQGEVGELMRSFNSMTEELGKTAYLQKDFISSISHEFRTPIASIKGFARLLQMPGLDESARQEYVGMIAQESERLSNLSNTLLRLSALERQMAPAALSAFRLDEQVRQVILQLEPAWSAKEIDWQLNLDEVTIESDADLLIQVWINLIQNAVKFSEKGGSIEITVAQTDMAEFTIRDHGIGMSEETMARLFDRF